MSKNERTSTPRVDPRVLAAAQAAARLSDEQLVAESARYEKAKRIEGQVKALAGECQGRIVGEMEARGVREFGQPGTHITLVQKEARVIDAAGLYAVSKPGWRRWIDGLPPVFRTELDLNALPEAERERIAAALSPAMRRGITRHVLDAGALDARVAAGGIRAATVEVFTTITRSAPYIRVSHGPRR
ncbi:MAG TPA: hypothetical protein VGC13_22360 [Longimicrobium sp.]|jgi:hypothetical protein|uniref:hypothetical protein n=1 Tax=Longimicrobium sp. TaxID=2029185 RepID=UPI002EDA36EC